MKVRSKGVLAVASLAVGALVAVVGVTSANASQAVAAPISIDVVNQAITTASQTVEGWDEETAEETASLVAQHGADLTSTGGLDVDLSNTDAWQVDLNTTLLRASIVPEDGVIEPSAVSLLIDRHTGAVNSNLETVFLPRTENSGVVRAWIDGELKIDRIVSEAVAPTTSTETRFEAVGANIKPAKPIGSGEWWQEINNCLASAGVPAWVLAGISIICGAACVAAGTPPGLAACALCIAAAAGFAAGVVQQCIERANKA